MGKTIISKPDDIVKNKLMSDNSWFHHDQEVYVYSKEIRIRQRKKLFGYEDITETGTKRAELEKCLSDIAVLKDFCQHYGIRYTENSSSDISIETEPSGYSSKKYHYKVETVRNSLEFSISRQLYEEIVQKRGEEFYKNTMDILKQKSGEWYERFAGSDTLNILSDKFMEVLNGQVDKWKKLSIENRQPNVYTQLRFNCNKECLYYPINSQNYPNIVYNDIGLKNLENDEQAAAVAAVITERIIKRLKSDPDMAIVTARYTEEKYGINIMAYMKVDIGPQDDLKSWY